MSLDRYFDRKAALERARQEDCPSCEARSGERCTDRWGLPTSLVHRARTELVGYADAYGMEASPR